MAVGTIRNRIITDTCSALKLLALGEKLFAQGKLPSGDLIIHPRVFNETKLWRPERKEKYKNELAALVRVRSTPNLSPPAKDFDRLQEIIKATILNLSLSVGRVDIEQLAAALHHNLKMVTNDGPFAEVAAALEVEVLTAEAVLVEAFDSKVITLSEAKATIAAWQNNNEKKPSAVDDLAFKKRAFHTP